jgi:CheY-like chemotaxis protein
MPGIDGFALVQKIRQDEKLSDIQVLGMSGKDVTYSQAIEAGFDDFYAKQEGLLSLLEKVKGFLGSS